MFSPGIPVEPPRSESSPTPKRATPARLKVERIDTRAVRHLRSRPLLLLDATLHPALAPLLDLDHVVVGYDQGRSVVQVLTSLLMLPSLREGENSSWRLTKMGCWVVSALAAWFAGRKGYVLCRKALRPLFEREASRYYELRRVEFVTVWRERGWDADPDARVFAVVGRYAKNADACIREAHALRSVHRQVTGSTEQLDALESAPRAQPFRGRGCVLLYRGEPVERVTTAIADPLAAALQDADRIAVVRQFIGRDRVGRSFVLLLRGDPTIPSDALVEDIDLATALPADARQPRRRAIPVQEERDERPS